MRWLAIALWLTLTTIPAVAQTTAGPTLPSRVRQLVPLLAGRDVPDYLAPAFTAQVSPAQLAAVTAQLRETLGEPDAIVATRPDSAWSATLTVGYARGTATVRIALDPIAEHRVVGLLVTGTTQANDTLERLTADFRALPGSGGFGIYRLGSGAGGGDPVPLAQWRGEAGAPVGSSFKLWLLAEAVRQVAAGRHRWTDVVPLGAPSLPSGITQNWPAGTPMTLQGLATLAISISDNTTADTLLRVLGRGRVDALATRLRWCEPGRTLPVLSTREAFAIKLDPALRAAWLRGDRDARMRLLADDAATIEAAPLPAEAFAGGAVAAETVEWFAAPVAMARTLDWLRLHGDAAAQAIMGVNPGTDPATSGLFDRIGFKGGSEPGVVAMNWLVRTKDGRWLAVAGNWHGDAVKPLTFATLMNRALALAAR
ncbi:serine hydrolase [Sphingomonas bacterium]|uniref:serine hydrolase n=1 Tax=Sphingomonas bacterium TaxID=1895847 RepID=UPI001576DA9F|nr:serine hydrolase [Sphingomonas bacterium]